MSRNPHLKQKFFRQFSENLEYVQANNGLVRFVPEIKKGGYVCPTCFEIFFEKDLKAQLSQHLTLEHVPPERLGGKAMTLTCKKCNSKSGSDLDKVLLTYLEEMDCKTLLPNSKINAGFDVNGNKINGKMRVDETGQVHWHLDPKRSNPVTFNKVVNDLSGSNRIFGLISDPDSYHLPVKITSHNKPNERLVEIALLRIAYLLAYSTFGNSVFINHGMMHVREQIVNPHEEILEPSFLLKNEFPDHIVGMNIIKEPKELRSFLIVFNLKTNSTTRQFSVLLPGLTNPSIAVYKNLKNLLSGTSPDGNLHFELQHLPSKNFVRNDSMAFAYLDYWKMFADTG